MKQIVDFDSQLKDKILLLENECQKICEKYKAIYFEKFQLGKGLLVDVIRIRKGKSADQDDLFEEDYESFIEIGLEHEGEYYPDGYIPLWKCKSEWLQMTGYLTNRSLSQIEATVSALLTEMLEDSRQEE
ncbi:hypothetical protein [Neobacillus terrae]|uniref:hypothetical protein n=1 Tax=Neobacillus terrae TaxID=3034837 RepID=UPI00140917C8|nr:hypothetical protein [Neobacillus terrae]NHM29335.1 hypothetical protein [Neobacillus terrae]